MECIIRGNKADLDKKECLRGVEQTLGRDLAAGPPDIRKVIASLDRLGEYIAGDPEFLVPELMDYGFSREESLQIKKESRTVLCSDELFRKVRKELGELPFDVKRVFTREEEFEGWMPVGVLGHVTSSNDAMLPFYSAVEGILAGNINVIKTASGANRVAMRVIGKLCEMEPSLCPFFYVFPFSSKDQDLLREMFALCNVIAVWGSDRATSGVRELAPSGVRIVEWGNRISFAYFTKAGRTPEGLRGLAEDTCVNDQQACSAPQIVYYEAEDNKDLDAFAEELAAVLQEVSDTYPLHPMTEAERAEMTSQVQLCYLDELMGTAKLLDGKGCRIFVRYDSTLEASPLYRTLLVKPIRREDVVTVLRPYRSYLQTAGLSCGVEEVSELGRMLTAGGVNRITEPGLMMGGYTGEPHDGVFALPCYLKRVSVIQKRLPKGMMSFQELDGMGEAPFAPGTPLLRKSDFPSKREITDQGYLLLKSGGSSGAAKYAPHSYNDAEVTYEEGARFLIAAGVDPKRDICMNLFYSGGLYGGFISIYEALKKADVVQLPMAAEMDMALVAKEIVNNRVNVLVGMPTYLLRLFREQEQILKDYGGVEKILYAGEHFDPAQVEFLKEQFGVKRVGSLAYGCNEIGSMGYACEECEKGVHHVVGSKYLEVLKMDEDIPAEEGEVGRLVWTPMDQENIGIQRYEIGDLGRLVTEPCPCGRKAPRFELLGRFGDTFKFATNYVSYSKLKAVFGKELQYTGWLQVLLDYDGISVMTICVEEDISCPDEKIIHVLRESYPEMEECIRDKTGTIHIRRQGRDAFILSTGGGKVRSVVDRRGEVTP